MKCKLGVLLVTVLAYSVVAQAAYAQRGVGQRSGVASRSTLPEVVRIAGKLLEVKTEPCQATTGRSSVGTHILLETTEGQALNVHLGPAAEVADIAGQLVVGRKVTAECFRTEEMKENHYVAKSLKMNGKSIRLRDDNLRPFWAGGSYGPPVRSGLQAGSDETRAAGYGRGSGWGRSRGAGYGRGFGRGRGPGRGFAGY
jgi:hypothetical protein